MGPFHTSRRSAARGVGTLFGRGITFTLESLAFGSEPVKILTLSDGTFTRNSSASYHNGSTSSIAWVGPNVLRSEDRNDGYGSQYLIEGYGENILRATEDLTNNSVWTRDAGFVISGNVSVGPDGSLVDRCQIGATANNDTRQTVSAFALTASMTAFLKNFSGSGTCRFDLQYDAADHLTNITANSEWEREEFIYPVSASSNIGVLLLNSNDESKIIDATFFQLEKTAFPTSYISSSITATGSRAADQLYFESASVPSQVYNGRWYIDVFPYFTEAENSGQIKTVVAFSASLGRDEIRLQGDQVIVREGFSSIVTLSNLSWARHERLRIWVDPTTGELSLSSSTNGQVSAFGNAWNWPSEDRMYIGARSDPTSSPFFGRVSDIYSGTSPYIVNLAEMATFSRESEASWFRDSGLLEWWDSGSLRNLGDGTYAIEGSKTNYEIDSEHYDSYIRNSLDASELNQDDTGPDGNPAYSINWSGAELQQLNHVSADQYTGSYVGSLFHKLVSGTPGSAHEWRPARNYGTVKIENIGASSSVNTWIRFSASGDLTGQNKWSGFRNNTNAHKSAYFGAQVETGSFATSYIRTSGSAAIRVADDLRLPSTLDFGTLLNNNRIRIDLWPEASSDDVINNLLTQYIVQNNGNNYILLFETGGTARFRYRAGGATSVTSDPVTFDRNQKMSIYIDASNGELTVSGANSGNTSIFSGIQEVFATGVEYRIGSTVGGTLPFFGRISNIYNANTDYLLDYNFATFSRESEASWWDGSTLQWWDSGSARIITSGAIVVEGSRTNLAQYSENLNGINLGAGTVTNSQSIAPDGEADAYTYEQLLDSFGPFGNLSQPNDARILSLFTKASSSADIGKDFRYRYANENVPTGSYWGKVTASLAADWARHISAPFLTGNGSGANNSNWLPEGRTDNPESGDPALPAMGYVYWGAQLETGSFATSYIRSSGSQATRVADDCSFATVPYAMRSGSWVFEFTPEASSDQMISGGANQNMFVNIGAFSRIRFVASTARLQWRGETGNLVQPVISFDANSTVRVTLNHAAGEMNVSGAREGDGDYDSGGLEMYWGDTTLQVGAVANLTDPFFGKISRPWLSGTNPQ